MPARPRPLLASRVREGRFRAGRRLLALALCLVAIPAAAAEASTIVYQCGPDLCAVDPDTRASSPLTRDGAGNGAYRFPSLSRDGRRLAAVRGNDVLVGGADGNLTERWAGTRDMNDAALAPDGAAVAESHSYVENVYGCPLTGGCLQLVDRSRTFYVPGGQSAESRRAFPGGGGTGFLGAGTLLSSFYSISTDTHAICVVDPAVDDAVCEPRVVDANTLTAPAGSPDGTLIAAAVGVPGADRLSVNLYDAATGALVRRLAGAGTDPAFSPDGKQIAYGGPDGWIHVVAARGGKARRLVAGSAPTWGGGTADGGRTASVVSKRLRLRRGRVATKVRCAGSGACRGALRLKKGRTTLGSRSYRIRPGGRATVSVKLTPRGRRAVAKRRRYRVTVQLDPARGRTIATRLLLRR